MNYNLWMGNSAQGSSSGLHHDYHDNLYVLLSGRKRFRLYSPADTQHMYLRGDVTLVHENGRICYAGAVTLADGTDPKVLGSEISVLLGACLATPIQGRRKFEFLHPLNIYCILSFRLRQPTLIKPVQKRIWPLQRLRWSAELQVLRL